MMTSEDERRMNDSSSNQNIILNRRAASERTYVLNATNDHHNSMNDESNLGKYTTTTSTTNTKARGPLLSIINEALYSLKLVSQTSLNILLIFCPIALIGSKSGALGDALVFCLAGLALIPCAERLSFVTEQVAEHTNETIGALLNATFGNAPEFLISSAALRSGFYRVVQLTLLGSVLCNLLFVFGLSCFIGGLQWQVQELRITSGNVSIGMLLFGTMGLVLPLVLKTGRESVLLADEEKAEGLGEDILTHSDVAFSRVNALIMVVGYIAYLIFQLGTHKDEFDYDGDDHAHFGGGHNIIRTSYYQNQSIKKKHTVRRNLFCRRHCPLIRFCPDASENDLQYETLNLMESGAPADEQQITIENLSHNDDQLTLPQSLPPQNGILYQRSSDSSQIPTNEIYDEMNSNKQNISTKSKNSDIGDIEDEPQESPMTMRMGLLWLAIITLLISSLSDAIVDTIGGFAQRSRMSEVFTSVIFVPYFSNIAEQVSAIIFAYRNKMDLCIGVTVGSAIQVCQFVMPGCVLVGWVMDKPMTLYYRGYETACLLLGVISVAAVLQGGTTNWLVGFFCVGIYVMIAAGFFFHEIEDLDIVTNVSNSTIQEHY